MAGTINEKLEAARAARRESRFDDATSAYRDVVSGCRDTGQTEELIAAVKGLAQIERDRGNVRGALPHYQEAIRLARDACDRLVLAHTMRHLADTYRELGDVENAEENYMAALALYRAQPGANELDLANAIRPMAILMENLGCREKALELWEEAGRLYATVGIDDGASECREALKRMS